MEKIRIGVSACLLGEKVRYDGQHKLDSYITETLSQCFHLIAVCPELELGLGVPRETMQLEGNPDSPRLMTKKNRIDLTERMLIWSQERVQGLMFENLRGFIFKSNSPSCGIEDVAVLVENRSSAERGSGLFAQAFMKQFPELPVIDEEQLQDPALRAGFIARVSQ